MGTLNQSDFLQALGWAVLNSLWQMALLWILYQLIFLCFNQARPGFKASLASLFLFAGFGWFIATFISLLYSFSWSGYDFSGFLSPDTVQQSWLINMLPAATLVYLALLVFPIANFIRNYRYVQVLRTTGLSKAGVQWRIFAKDIAARMGIKQPVKVWMSELVHSPVTIGYLKPIILLPVAAVSQLTPAQTEAVLLHELAHIRRYDFLINLCCRIIRTILYFNPFVRAFSQMLEKERERHCDEMVVQFQYDRHSYAAALLLLEQSAHARQRLAMAAAAGKKNELLHRVESILGIEQKKPFSLHKLGSVLASMLLLVAVNMLLFIGTPAAEANAPGMASLHSPLYFSDNTAVPSTIAAIQPEIDKEPVINTSASLNSKPADKQEQQQAAATMPEEAAAFSALPEQALLRYVTGHELSPQELNKEEELLVKEAVQLSKKVLEDVQWKAVEKEIADALSSLEKAEVKEAYQKATEQVTNWEKMENKLRASYDLINWDAVTAELNNAAARITLDSLQQVYAIALSNLDKMQREMSVAGQKSIPDSDITTQSLEVKKKELNGAIKKINTIRSRKIIKI
ncbi:MAG TPA: M56 family metallopeptidase [Chitinophagaceae bacterium]|mgnify:CR=1 FL=1|nr:M56 family metallopeptidase [Chitinophagaceae bacterium]